MIETRAIHAIAKDIAADWVNVNYAAKPYLAAMLSMNSVSDSYYQDAGSSVVRYFLANAGSWRGSKAKAIKAELRAML